MPSSSSSAVAGITTGGGSPSAHQSIGDQASGATTSLAARNRFRTIIAVGRRQRNDGGTHDDDDTVAPPIAATSDKPLVTVVGDSITVLSTAKIEHALSPAYLPDVHAVVGSEMTYWAPMIQSIVQSDPPHDWIVELGTNDAYYADNANFASDFASEVNELSSQRCVVLVTVNPTLSSAADQLDQQMAQVAATQSTFHLLDWGSLELDNPKWLLSDHVHPSHRGSAELAKLERNAVEADC